VGFEPTVPVTRDSGFQDRHHKPLGHPSSASDYTVLYNQSLTFLMF
jgi:hypothetical protein